MVSNIKIYFQISVSSGVPIYRQIIDQVKLNIATNKFNDDDYLPSVRQVAKELEVNPMTVSKAYSILEKENVLEFVRGKGMKIQASHYSGTEVKTREDELRPIMQEAVVKAKQLSLDLEKTIHLMKVIWKENNDA